MFLCFLFQFFSQSHYFIASKFEWLLLELQSYYPERLAKCYILHMPWFFVSVWRFVSGFLDKATQEKVLFPILSWKLVHCVLYWFTLAIYMHHIFFNGPSLSNMLEGMLLALVIDQIVLVSHQSRQNVMQNILGMLMIFYLLVSICDVLS